MRSLAFAAMLLATAASAEPTPPDLVAPAPFDYYVLTLSWSPGFCDTGGESRSPEQCDSGSNAAFVTHGLWPNETGGRDPCGDKLQQDYVPSSALSVGERVYPTRGLAIHEWRTHGVCTGLDAQHYFRAVQFARDEFTIPENLRHPTARFETNPGALFKAFADVNANLTAESMAVTCERGELIDVRFCLTRDLRAFAICPDVARRSCRSGSISVSPPR
jgi:ribonuclease T2